MSGKQKRKRARHGGYNYPSNWPHPVIDDDYELADWTNISCGREQYCSETMAERMWPEPWWD